MNIIETLKSTLPKYNTIQPSTGEIVTFRPFTVKEEKILLIANQTGSYEDFLSTLTEVIDNCFELKKPSNKLPLFDIEFFFLKLRAKSVSEIVEPIIVCPITNEKIKFKIDLDQIQPTINKDHKKEIQVSPNIIVKMKYPTISSSISKSGESLDYYDLIINCIESIQTPNELFESGISSRETINEFVDLLTKEQFLKIVEFFKTMPQIQHEVEYMTSDKTKRSLILKGLRDFFQ